MLPFPTLSLGRWGGVWYCLFCMLGHWCLLLPLQIVTVVGHGLGPAGGVLLCLLLQ